MDLFSNKKMVILSISQYLQNPNENTKAQFLRHSEVLLANVKAFPPSAFFQHNVSQSRECVSKLMRVLETENSDSHVVGKILTLISILFEMPFSKMLLFGKIDVNLSLMQYVIKYAKSVENTSVQECLFLLEKTTYDCKVSNAYKCLDKFLTYILCEIETSDRFSSTCLGILSNLVSCNLAIQAKVKGMLSGTKIKNILNYLRQDSMSNRICALFVVTCICWEDELAKKLFSIKNVSQTIKLVFSQMSIWDDLLAQHRAADLCVELLKRENIAEQVSIFDSEYNCTFKLLMLLQNDIPHSASYKIFEVLLAFCQLSTVRHSICSKVFNSEPAWQVLFNSASHSHLNSDFESSLMALALIKELSEEVIDSSIDFSKTLWFDSLLKLLTHLLSTSSSYDENSDVADLILKSKLTKQLKCIEVLNCFCVDETATNCVVELISTDSLCEVIDFQLTHNSAGASPSAPNEWTNVGARIILYSLQLLLHLRQISSDFENLLFAKLQDSNLTPFLAKAIAGCDREELKIALRLHQEALPLPEYPSVSLVETIGCLNESKSSMISIGQLPTKGDSISYGVLQASNLVNTVKPPDSENLMTNYWSQQLQDKENIKTLVENMKSIGSKFQFDDAAVPQNNCQLIEMYENKILSLTTSMTHLDDLLEVRTTALSQADRIIKEKSLQIVRYEQDSKKLADILHETEKRTEKLSENVRIAECDRSSMERELETVVEENRNLQKVADQYDRLQNAFQDISHKNEVLDRNLTTSRQEYDTLKELHDMIQKHSEKLKRQHNQAAAHLEEVEEEKLKLLKRVSQLESSVSDLTQLVEEQDRASQALMREKAEQDATIKSIKHKLSRREEVIKELKIKVSTQENNKQQVELQLKEHKSENKKLNDLVNTLHREIESFQVDVSNLRDVVSKKEEELNALKHKHSQTIRLITELSNNVHGGQ